MSNEAWIAVGIVFVVVWVLLIWEAWNTPITPDDYGIEDKELWKELNGSKDEEQYKKGFYNGEEDKWYPDNKI